MIPWDLFRITPLSFEGETSLGKPNGKTLYTLLKPKRKNKVPLKAEMVLMAYVRWKSSEPLIRPQAPERRLFWGMHEDSDHWSSWISRRSPRENSFGGRAFRFRAGPT